MAPTPSSQSTLKKFLTNLLTNAAKMATTAIIFCTMLLTSIYFSPDVFLKGGLAGLGIIFAPPIWACLATLGTIGLIAAYKKLTHQNSGSFINRNAGLIAWNTLSSFVFGLRFMEPLIALSGFSMSISFGIYTPLIESSVIAVPLLLSHYALTFGLCFAGLLIPSIITTSLAFTLSHAFKEPKEKSNPTPGADSLFLKLGKNVGYNPEHPLLKKMQKFYKDATIEIPNTEVQAERYVWAITTLQDLAKTPLKNRRTKEAQISSSCDDQKSRNLSVAAR